MRENPEEVEPSQPLISISRILELPWIAPGADTLADIANHPSAILWDKIRHDPGLVLMLLRSTPGSPWQPETPAIAADNPEWIGNLLVNLSSDPVGLLNPSHPQSLQILQFSQALAKVCHGLATRHRMVHPEKAWVAGLLAPMGWLAISSVYPNQLPGFMRPLGPEERWGSRQQEQWGMRHSSVIRRLARHWNLPEWLTVTLTASGIQNSELSALGGDPSLWHLLRVSIDLVNQSIKDIGLVNAEDVQESMKELGWTNSTIDIRWVREQCQEARQQPFAWKNPYQQPLLRSLLVLAKENRRLKDTQRFRKLEEEIDRLHIALDAQNLRKIQQLHSDKLEAMAEFAAGAGHEINNPLAVISGQAQYLMNHHETWFTEEGRSQVQKALQTVVAQTRRVHSILKDVMQYARPAQPKWNWTDLPALIASVATSHQEVASQKKITLDLKMGPDRLEVHIDADQIRTALACLLKNAIEAAPQEGWARLTLLQAETEGPVDILVEDNGPGPDPAQIVHIFEPFFSGRNAGRGRGMGLPIAWRLSRLQGGDVWLARTETGQPTRFVLRIPYRDPNVLPIRKVA